MKELFAVVRGANARGGRSIHYVQIPPADWGEKLDVLIAIVINYHARSYPAFDVTRDKLQLHVSFTDERPIHGDEIN